MSGSTSRRATDTNPNRKYTQSASTASTYRIRLPKVPPRTFTQPSFVVLSFPPLFLLLPTARTLRAVAVIVVGYCGNVFCVLIDLYQRGQCSSCDILRNRGTGIVNELHKMTQMDCAAVADVMPCASEKRCSTLVKNLHTMFHASTCMHAIIRHRPVRHAKVVLSKPTSRGCVHIRNRIRLHASSSASGLGGSRTQRLLGHQGARHGTARCSSLDRWSEHGRIPYCNCDMRSASAALPCRVNAIEPIQRE